MLYITSEKIHQFRTLCNKLWKNDNELIAPIKIFHPLSSRPSHELLYNNPKLTVYINVDPPASKMYPMNCVYTGFNNKLMQNSQINMITSSAIEQYKGSKSNPLISVGKT